jgi:hypothetical protein
MRNDRKAKKGAERFLTFLTEAGYRHPSIAANGDVLFSWEGRTYVVKIDGEDPLYFSLTHAAYWPLASDEERSQARRAADAITADYKGVKIFLRDTRAWVAIEQIYFPQQLSKDVFAHCLNVLYAAEKQFDTLLNEPPERQDDFLFHLPRYTVGEN